MLTVAPSLFLRRKSFLTYLTVLTLCISAGSFAQITPPKQYFTVEVNPENAPKVDGFDDSIWDKAEWGSDFVEDPDENTPPTEQTFKILYDQKHLYIALLALI